MKGQIRIRGIPWERIFNIIRTRRPIIKNELYIVRIGDIVNEDLYLKGKSLDKQYRQKYSELKEFLRRGQKIDQTLITKAPRIAIIINKDSVPLPKTAVLRSLIRKAIRRACVEVLCSCHKLSTGLWKREIVIHTGIDAYHASRQKHIELMKMIECSLIKSESLKSKNMNE